ncbi:MAG: hypothetical protein WKF71_12995 [Pyrinomonadaceae bacterium]
MPRPSEVITRPPTETVAAVVPACSSNAPMSAPSPPQAEKS